MAGKGIANAVDPVAEDAYWRDNYSKRPYARGSDYEEYGPAYGYGVDATRDTRAARSMKSKRNRTRLDQQARTFQPRTGQRQARGAPCVAALE
jgi:hypothetical protein